MNDLVVPYLTEINHLAGVANAPDVKNVTISSNTSLASTQDGEMVTLFARNLTIEAGATLTVANRCKGLRIICFGNCNVYGTISMTARGAQGAGEDVTIDIATQTLFTVKFPSEMRTIDRYLKNFFNPNSTFDDLPDSIRPEVSRVAVSGQTIGTVPATGAAGGSGRSSVGAGSAGSAGTGRRCGGGGGGGCAPYNSTTSGAGGSGTAFSGGAGGGGACFGGTAGSGSSAGGAGGNGNYYNTATAYVSCGGAGNPGGSATKTKVDYPTGYGSVGTGGLLILIVLGGLTIHPTGSIESKGASGGGSPDTSGYRAGGGGSGGGSLNIAYGTTYINNGTVTAAGGAGGVVLSGNNGGAGGAGCVTVEQLS